METGVQDRHVSGRWGGCRFVRGAACFLVLCLFVSVPALALDEIDYDTRVFEIGRTDLMPALVKLHEGDYRQVERAAQRMIRSGDEVIVTYGTVLMARAKFAQGDQEQGAEIITPVFEQVDDLLNGKAEVVIELGRLEMARDRYLSALRLFSRVGANTEGLTQASAAEGMSDAFMQLHKWDKSLEWINFAVKTVQKEAKQIREENRNTPGPPGGQSGKDILMLLRHKQRQVRLIRDVMSYGLGFVLYKQAHAKELSGDYEAAALAYRQLLDHADRNRGHEGLLEKLLAGKPFDPNRLMELPIAPVYEAAAELYFARCAVELGQGRRVQGRLKAFIARQPLGPYRGEAMELLGDIALEWQFNPKAAIRHYSRACEWFDTIKEKDQEIDSYEVPGKARHVTAPPRRMKGQDRWGNVDWQKIQPGDMVYRRHADWYVDYHRMMSKIKRSLCHFIEGNKEAALEDIKIINEVDEIDAAITKQGLFSNYLRLRDGYRIGKLFARPEELALFRGKARTALLVADFYYEIEQWKQAQVRYRRIIEAGGEHLSTGQRAYLDFVIANCDAMQGRVTEAEKQLRRFLEDADYARTPTWPRAVLIIACSYAEGASRYPLLKLVAERASGHPLGNQALLVLAQDYYALGRWEASKATFEKLQSRSPRPWRAIIARRFLRDLDQKLSSP